MGARKLPNCQSARADREPGLRWRGERGHPSGAPDFFYGGVGNDTYYVNSGLTGAADLVFEGVQFTGSQGGVNDVDTIHSQGALFWEWRSAVSLARLWIGQDRKSDASQILAPVCGASAKGLQIADVREARALLGELAGGKG